MPILITSGWASIGRSKFLYQERRVDPHIDPGGKAGGASHRQRGTLRVAHISGEMVENVHVHPYREAFRETPGIFHPEIYHPRAVERNPAPLIEAAPKNGLPNMEMKSSQAQYDAFTRKS